AGRLLSFAKERLGEVMWKPEFTLRQTKRAENLLNFVPHPYNGVKQESAASTPNTLLPYFASEERYPL
ncbi:MAG: hypothetical protein NT023_18320, partial [Armatimonadetes bacterium]|nr:hypothetical protein [Armatimonadota bacterium]